MTSGFARFAYGMIDYDQSQRGCFRSPPSRWYAGAKRVSTQAHAIAYRNVEQENALSIASGMAG
jgi:hypothetical protein